MFLYILLFIISSIAYNRIKNRRFIHLVNQFPGPPALPIVGNALRSFKRSPEDVVQFFKTTREQYGRICKVWAFNRAVLFVYDPKVSEKIFTSSSSNLGKNNVYNFLRPWLGDGLLLSDGTKWHTRRKILTPAFHFTILEQFCDVFDKEASILVENLKVHENQKAFKINDYVSLMTLDIVCQTAMGVEINAQTDAESKYVKAVHEITSIVANRLANMWKRFDILMKTFDNALYIRQMEAIKALHSFTEEIIKTRRAELAQSTDKNMENDSNQNIEKRTKKMALLDILLKSSVDGEPLSNEAIREEVDTFMFGGHDTTTAGICYTLFLLSRNKHVQDKLFAEITEILARVEIMCIRGDDKNRPITYRELQELKYIELVIKESMRLLPPVPLIGRKIDEEITLDDGRIIPVGSNININFYVMFRDAELFENAETFEPERFELENNKMNSFSFTPFSAGKRNCIGQKYAMLEMKSTITKVLRHFEVTPEGPDVIPLIEIVLRSKNGIHLGLKPRQYC